MHAAVDANCLGAATTEGYWNYVDYVHAHAADDPLDEKTIAKANEKLDKLALDEGARQKVNQPELVACVLKQDSSKVKASEKEAEADPLSIGSTPVLFINGEKVEGVVPVETIYQIIDGALIAAGQTPPPAPPRPAAPAAPARAGSDQARELATELQTVEKRETDRMSAVRTDRKSEWRNMTSTARTAAANGTAVRTKMSMGTKIAAGALPVALLLLSGCNRSHGVDVVATVNGHAIMRADMDRMYQPQLGQVEAQAQGQQPSPEQADELRLQIVHELITEEILAQRAAKLNLTATPEDVDVKLADLKAPYTEEQFNQSLAGQPYDAGRV